MIPKANLPREMKEALRGESIDFAVHSKGGNIVGGLFGKIHYFFLVFWGSMTGYIFLKMVFFFMGEGKEGIRGVTGFALFALFGLGAILGLVRGWTILRSFLQAESGYFVGTKTDFVHCDQGKVVRYEWSQFLGSVSVDLEKARVSLYLRQDADSSKKKSPFRITMLGIDKVSEIQEICNHRIEEYAQNLKE